MTILRMKSILSIFLLASDVLALQVSPNSPCASVCLDNPTADPSDPASSNTYSTDIVCSNADYDFTAVGRKFESCTDCLRNSTTSSSGENDQGWFLYNLRFALDSCVFGFPNVSDFQSTPCSLDNACGPLRESLEDGNLVPANESFYSYCSANGNALLGSYLSGCITCLQDDSDEAYLANFLIVLEAGCLQQPAVGINIGIHGNIFSSSPINITFPGDLGTTTAHKKGLTETAIIGLAIGLAAFVIIAIGVIFVYYRKKHYTRNMKQLTSPLDPRFGAKNISTPNSGSYGNPYANPYEQTPQSSINTALSPKERTALGLEMPNFTSGGTAQDGWQDAHAHLEATQGQLPAYTAIPAHKAYIPAANASISPATSTSTNNNFQISSYASSRSAPKNPPPPIKVSPPRVQAPAPKKVHALHEQPTGQPVASHVPPPPKVQPAPIIHPPRFPRAAATYPAPVLHDSKRVSIKVQAAPVLRSSTPQDKQPPSQISIKPNSPTAAGLPRNLISQDKQPKNSISINTQVPAATGLPRFPSPEDKYPMDRISIDTKAQRATGFPRAPTPQDRVLPQFPPRATVTGQQTQAPQFQAPQQEASQIARPGLHSQQQAFQSVVFSDNRPPSRAESWKRSGGQATVRDTSTERTTAGGWKRSGSRGTVRDSSTERTTAGGWKRSGSRGSIRASSKERLAKSATPVRISGPMIKHSSRFDFEAAEQEMREREERIKKGPDTTPASADSGEQWPGTY